RSRLHDLGAELGAAPLGIGIRLGTAQPVVDVQCRHAIAERAERVPQAGRVGAAGDEAQDLAAGLDQLVAADVRLDALEELQASIEAQKRDRKSTRLNSSHANIS